MPSPRLCLGAALLLSAITVAQDGGMPTCAEALALAFPGAKVQEEVTALADAQRKRLTELLGSEWEPAEGQRHVARRAGVVVGTAFVDTARVRTHKQTLLIVLDQAGKVARIEVLAFAEPRQYAARGPFLDQFTGKGLEDGVQLRRAIRPIAGATLTARATTDAVRRALALHTVLGPPADDRPDPQGGEGQPPVRR